MRYGYARVSTTDQDFTIQEAALRAAGCETSAVQVSRVLERVSDGVA